VNLWSFFRRTATQDLMTEELREGLLKAASESPRTLTSFCRQHRQALMRNAEALRTVPVAIRDDPPCVAQYMRAMIAVTECLAQRCVDPRLLEMLIRTVQENPLLRWDRLSSPASHTFLGALTTLLRCFPNRCPAKHLRFDLIVIWLGSNAYFAD
jgi:hypothetical protein